MIFNSWTFLVFFALVMFVHSLPLGWTVKKFNLLIFSYLFYAAWSPVFVLLLMLSATLDFFLARWMGRTIEPRTRKGILILSLAINLGALGLFKYGLFLQDNLIGLLGLAGIHYHPLPLPAILPLGISFYTFETISYLVDVYRKRIDPWDSYLDYALFLTFFPHLVAGPIVRAHDFLPQCRAPRKASLNQVGWGLSLLVFGLFEKVVLADALMAPIVDKVYGAALKTSTIDAWAGTLAFAAQILFDFSGYSTCAIGAALCLGFVLKENFHFPYAAVGFSDFWRRWHISLSTWLRDYLYIPLGGNREGRVRTYVNLMLTMLLGGLWHGASWRFVAWGGLHGLFLAGERALGFDRSRTVDARRTWRQIPMAVTTFLLVCLTWVFFRAADFPTALRMIESMGSLHGYGVMPHVISRTEAACVAMLIPALLVAQWLLRDASLESAVARLPWWLWSGTLALMTCSIVAFSGEDRAFFYFQF